MACARSASRTRGARSARGDDALGNNEKNAYRRWRYFNEAEVRRATRRTFRSEQCTNSGLAAVCAIIAGAGSRVELAWCDARVLEWSRLDERPNRRGNADIYFREFRLFRVSEMRGVRDCEKRNFGSFPVPAIFAAVDGAFRRAKWRQNIAFPT